MNFGLIADGNRRWAKAQDLDSLEGHRKGISAIKEEIIPHLKNNSSFDSITVYAFSTENWKRSPFAVKNLMDLYTQTLSDWLPDLIREQIRVIHAGRRDRIPAKLRDQLEKIEKITKDFSKFTVYLCIDYGGKDEIIRAAEQGSIEDNLEVPDLDIVMRTGGEHRISNFCIWQAAYAEFFFIDKHLPDVQSSDIKEILEKFTQKDRRKGR